MQRLIFLIGTAAWLAASATAAHADAGAIMPNVDVRAMTPPDDVTDRQLRAQGTPNGEQPPTGIMQFIFPELYAPAPAASYVSTQGQAGAGPSAPSGAAPDAPVRRSGNPLTRYFLPGLQGNPSGPASVGGMER